MHPGKEASSLHPKDRDEEVGDEDEEDEDGCDVVQAVQARLVGLFSDVSPGCNTRVHTHTHTKNNDKQYQDSTQKMQRNNNRWCGDFTPKMSL